MIINPRIVTKMDGIMLAIVANEEEKKRLKRHRRNLRFSSDPLVLPDVMYEINFVRNNKNNLGFSGF